MKAAMAGLFLFACVEPQLPWDVSAKVLTPGDPSWHQAEAWSLESDVVVGGTIRRATEPEEGEACGTVATLITQPGDEVITTVIGDQVCNQGLTEFFAIGTNLDEAGCFILFVEDGNPGLFDLGCLSVSK